MSEGKIGYEEYIPRDKWTIQDWFLHHLNTVSSTLQKVEVAYYMGNIDRRSISMLFGCVSAYYRQVQNLFEKFLKKEELASLVLLLEKDPNEVELCHARELVSIVSKFNDASGLFKIVESKPMGPFAYARKQKGLGMRKNGNNDS